METKFDTLKLKWGICFLLPILCLFIPTSEAFTPILRTFLMVTLFCIALTAMEVINLFIASLMFLVLYPLFGVASIHSVLGTFGSELVWFIICALLVVSVIEKYTILQRVAYIAVLKSQGSYLYLLLALCTVAMAIRVFLSSGDTIVCIAAITITIVDALGLRGTKAGVGIILTSAIAFLQTSFFYTPDVYAIFYTQANTITNLPTSYEMHFYHNAIFLLFPFIATLGIYFFTKPKEKIDLLAIEDLYKSLPKMNSTEIKIIVLLILFVTFLLTGSLHKLPPLYGFMILAISLFMPGINAGATEDVRKVNFSMILFVAACLSIGAAGNAAGIGKAVTELIVPLLEGIPEASFLGLLYIIAFLLNFIMTPFAEYAILALPITQICLDLGFSIYAAIYTVVFSTFQVLLPYELVPYLVVASMAGISVKDFAKIMGLVAIIATVFIFTLGFGYWTLIGLL